MAPPFSLAVCAADMVRSEGAASAAAVAAATTSAAAGALIGNDVALAFSTATHVGRGDCLAFSGTASLWNSKGCPSSFFKGRAPPPPTRTPARNASPCRVLATTPSSGTAASWTRDAAGTPGESDREAVGVGATQAAASARISCATPCCNKAALHARRSPPYQPPPLTSADLRGGFVRAWLAWGTSASSATSTFARAPRWTATSLRTLSACETCELLKFTFASWSRRRSTSHSRWSLSTSSPCGSLVCVAASIATK
mmetsp:Transcript_72047/g.199882  ORF Transcript_72047/g.199882 Transcript_72047/m.199882 type:complete len:256 (-) Transcript_72047:428-1195(-)